MVHIVYRKVKIKNSLNWFAMFIELQPTCLKIPQSPNMEYNNFFNNIELKNINSWYSLHFSRCKFVVNLDKQEIQSYFFLLVQ